MRSGPLAFLLVVGLTGSARAGMFSTPGGTLFDVPVRSLVDLRYEQVVRQQHDLSCGAAALATLLRFYYGERVTEEEVIQGIFEFGEKEKIVEKGFSMLELARYSKREGYLARGFRISDTEDLAQLELPVLALVSVRGYAHFVVIKGVARGEVYIADPAFGNRSRPLESFGREWNHVILAIVSKTRGGDSQFRLDPTPRARAEDVPLLIELGRGSLVPRAGEFR